MKIVQYPHPALRRVAKPLTGIDEQVRQQIRTMIDLMYEGRGLGLAGPQVALPYQVFVMNLTADPNQREHEHAYINPVILERKGSVEGEEGCLSFPGLYQKVRRAKTVKAQAYTLKGELVELELAELPARLWQHEVDHLHGKLYIDKMGMLAKYSARGALAEF